MLDIQKRTRQFLSDDLVISTWDNLKSYADDLTQRPWQSMHDFERWLQDWSEMQTVVYQFGTWCSIRIMQDTTDEAAKKNYDDYLKLISANMAKLEDGLQKRVLASDYAKNFKQPGFALTYKRWQASVDLYREQNVKLHVEDGIKNKEFGKIIGNMMVNLDGEEMTLQKAKLRLEWKDRTKREDAWRATQQRMLQDKPALDNVMSDLISLRHQIAQQADCENYRDYSFKAKQRFDYTSQDCFGYHHAVQQEVIPVIKKMQEEHAKAMHLDLLRPWDIACDPLGRPGLTAFANADELVDKSISVLDAIDPVFSGTIQHMKQHKFLDLASRPHKTPGASNSRMDEYRSSFMFANVTGSAKDMTTFMHEAGHAVHNVMQRNQPLRQYRNYPSEIAELASMSMELITGDQWHKFFPNEEECRRARLDHLQDRVEVLAHIARIDAFQHKIYEQPVMTVEQRHDYFNSLQLQHDTGMIDWSGLEQYRRSAWHAQMHIFELPFYYIEYAIAQIGAFQVWRNYKQDPKQALDQYKNALALGYTKSIPETYETAGIKFDFSAAMLKDLMVFVQKEMAALS